MDENPYQSPEAGETVSIWPTVCKTGLLAAVCGFGVILLVGTLRWLFSYHPEHGTPERLAYAWSMLISNLVMYAGLATGVVGGIGWLIGWLTHRS